MEDKVLTVKELCEYLRLSEKTVLNLLNAGKIPGKKLGGSWRILKSEVDKYFRGDK